MQVSYDARHGERSKGIMAGYDHMGRTPAGAAPRTPPQQSLRTGFSVVSACNRLVHAAVARKKAWT